MDLRVQACCRHYPGGPLGRIAHGTAYSSRFLARQRLRPSPPSCRVGVHIGRFEACSTFTRVTACLLAAWPEATRLSRRLRRFRCLHRRSDSYRLERPICRVGIAPTEDPRLFTAHNQDRPAVAPRVLLRPGVPSALRAVGRPGAAGLRRSLGLPEMLAAGVPDPAAGGCVRRAPAAGGGAESEGRRGELGADHPPDDRRVPAPRGTGGVKDPTRPARPIPPPITRHPPPITGRGTVRMSKRTPPTWEGLAATNATHIEGEQRNHDRDSSEPAADDRRHHRTDRPSSAVLTVGFRAWFSPG